MQITVKLFAGLAETLGRAEITCDLPETASVEQLTHTLAQLYPQLKPQLSRILVGVNRTYAQPDTRLSATDEVALIPPVGGGSPESKELSQKGPRTTLPSCLISTEPLDITEAFSQLESVYCGGTVLFCGTVREWTKGRQTKSLTYEAYKDMAEEQMKLIEDDVRAKWPGTLTVQWHRVGHLDPTDIAVICAASSPHRDAAFDAARTLIERLKKEVPIWKKEFYADGDPSWQPNER